MEEKKKKKKLTLSISSGKTHNVSHYGQSSGKTSVVIKRRPKEDGVKKNFNYEIIILINLNQLVILFQKGHQ